MFEMEIVEKKGTSSAVGNSPPFLNESPTELDNVIII